MDDKIKLSLMREAIAEANKSKAEDGRNHPLVGAIVTDDDGRILLRAHRGEDGGGGHAEYLIFQKAKKSKIDLSGKTLFVTLEPCTRRGPGKIPSRVRFQIISDHSRKQWENLNTSYGLRKNAPRKPMQSPHFGQPTQFQRKIFYQRIDEGERQRVHFSAFENFFKEERLSSTRTGNDNSLLGV